MKKYELTSETKVVCGRTLHRIKALIDFADIKAGELGGWVESEDNLSQNGICWVYDEAMVFEGAYVRGEAMIMSNAIVRGYADINGEAKVSGNALILDCAQIGGTAFIAGIVMGDCSIDEGNVLPNEQVF